MFFFLKKKADIEAASESLKQANKQTTTAKSLKGTNSIVSTVGGQSGNAEVASNLHFVLKKTEEWQKIHCGYSVMNG